MDRTFVKKKKKNVHVAKRERKRYSERMSKDLGAT